MYTHRRPRPIRTWIRRWAIRAGILAGILLFLAAVIFVPGWWVGQAGKLAVPARLDAEASIRQTVLLLGGGLVAVIGVGYTHQRHVIDRRTNELQQDANYTDRYTAAVTQLGSDALTIRLGGVYALERIARDSAGDAETVQDVLAAFIQADTYRARTELDQLESFSQSIDIDGPTFVAPQDVSAAMIVLARRTTRRNRNRPRIDLSDSAVGAVRFPSGANLSDARLDGVYFNDAQMEKIDLHLANLTGATFAGCSGFAAAFIGVHAPSARFHDSNFSYADFSSARLVGASLNRANLRNARFVAAHLVGADLSSSDLGCADFTDADLQFTRFVDSNLEDTVFTGATNWHGSEFESANSWSETTVWPNGFVPSISVKSQKRDCQA